MFQSRTVPEISFWHSCLQVKTYQPAYFAKGRDDRRRFLPFAGDDRPLVGLGHRPVSLSPPPASTDTMRNVMTGLGTGLLLAIVIALTSSCAKEPERKTAFRLDQSLATLMSDVVDPSADLVWGAAGYIVTEAGETNLAPTTDEGWQQAANSASVVFESANLLMLPGRSRGEDWDEIASGMADAALAAKAAAENRHADALFEAGAGLYRVCQSCHQIYWVAE